MCVRTSLDMPIRHMKSNGIEMEKKPGGGGRKGEKKGGGQKEGNI